MSNVFWREKEKCSIAASVAIELLTNRPLLDGYTKQAVTQHPHPHTRASTPPWVRNMLCLSKYGPARAFGVAYYDIGGSAKTAYNAFGEFSRDKRWRSRQPTTMVESLDLTPLGRYIPSLVLPVYPPPSTWMTKSDNQTDLEGYSRQ